MISLGGNDLYGDSRARLFSTICSWCQGQRALARLERVVQSIHRLNPDGRIYLLGLYNPYRHISASAWIDTQVNLWDGRLIARLASLRTVTVVRIGDLLQRDDRISPTDRFHPGASGYAAIARRIAETF